MNAITIKNINTEITSLMADALSGTTYTSDDVLGIQGSDILVKLNDSGYTLTPSYVSLTEQIDLVDILEDLVDEIQLNLKGVNCYRTVLNQQSNALLESYSHSKVSEIANTLAETLSQSLEVAQSTFGEDSNSFLATFSKESSWSAYPHSEELAFSGLSGVTLYLWEDLKAFSAFLECGLTINFQIK